ncbi:hypothetical protein KCQ_05541 [Pectobacterium atrosepticum ICMP 1526]|uniref:hypothetical protein n=1 Tax=Pectobacterium atrosepticum TaxID=29471 RepID=UPI0005075988|nr:hypothetical protein [Pectobacterium atrosepticum]KFX10720.1 hypothetical protein JV34_22620 [Pectobacterium atrosepticum]KMK87247.1 hypothetical protein KCQ_05541 [Pectobacterium atrosepticum ICMP 1526]
MKTGIFHEQERRIAKLRSGKGVVRIESWMPNEQIGKVIRQKLEQSAGAKITVTYDVITDEMQRAAHGK